MDAIGGWRALEALIRCLTGAVPRGNDEAWMARYGRRR